MTESITYHARGDTSKGHPPPILGRLTKGAQGVSQSGRQAGCTERRSLCGNSAANGGKELEEKGWMELYRVIMIWQVGKGREGDGSTNAIRLDPRR